MGQSDEPSARVLLVAASPKAKDANSLIAMTAPAYPCLPDFRAIFLSLEHGMRNAVDQDFLDHL